ncbi:MAG: TFIIB-type zinc ribbon-containing protein [Leucobacter sp.]
MAENVIDTSNAKSDGLDKCPKCGSTEISLRPSTGMLVCHFCRHEWSEAAIEQKFGLDSAIGDLAGTVVASGAAGLQESAEDVLTLKCEACGAEVIVNTAEAMQSRCHWCRQTLSVNRQVHNGAVPDGLLPFGITRDDAIARITEFVKKRSFFAHPKFVREFAPSEVVGVYMPYLLLDANSHIDLTGHGEIETRSYTRKRGDDEVRLYDADVYQVARSFDLHIDDVVIESSGQRADIDWQRNTNNIINAIQPFDVKAAVEYNANYLRGFTSEKRDLDVTGLSSEAYDRVLSIGRARAEGSVAQYDRGVRWEGEHLTVKGTRWVAVYLPVWLYSYYDGRLTHFVAVNGRTGSTMGSVPVRQGRLIGVSVGIGVIGTIVGGLLSWVLG